MPECHQCTLSPNLINQLNAHLHPGRYPLFGIWTIENISIQNERREAGECAGERRERKCIYWYTFKWFRKKDLTPGQTKYRKFGNFLNNLCARCWLKAYLLCVEEMMVAKWPSTQATAMLPYYLWSWSSYAAHTYSHMSHRPQLSLSLYTNDVKQQVKRIWCRCTHAHVLPLCTNTRSIIF